MAGHVPTSHATLWPQEGKCIMVLASRRTIGRPAEHMDGPCGIVRNATYPHSYFIPCNLVQGPRLLCTDLYNLPSVVRLHYLVHLYVYLPNSFTYLLTFSLPLYNPHDTDYRQQPTKSISPPSASSNLPWCACACSVHPSTHPPIHPSIHRPIHIRYPI